MTFGPLDELARRPDATVLVLHIPEEFEDDGQVAAAREKYAAMVVVPLQGRSGNASALAGRDVVLWPWKGRPGRRAELEPFEAALSRSCARLRVIVPKDPADYLGPGDLNGHDPIGWARAQCLVIPPRDAVDLDKEWFGGTDAEIADVQMRGNSLPQRKVLPQMPRGLHARVAESEQTDGGPARQGELPRDGERISATWQTDPDAMREVWGSGADASRGLHEAPEGDVALSSPSFDASRYERVSAWAPPPDMIEDAETWPEPIDLFTRLPVPTLRPEYLPPELSRFVFDQSEIIGSDPGILALSVLATCAAATHDSIKIRPRRHDRWTEEARLWCGIVGDPGIKKTPPMKRALAPVRAHEIDWAAAHKAELPAYAIAQKRYAKAEAAAVNDSNYPVPEPPEKPAKRQLIAQDTTIEALAVALTDNPGGMLMWADELSGFFGSMDAYRTNGGKDKAFWLEAYGGGPRNVNRIGRDSIPVPNLSVGILGGIQPEPMRKISAKLDDDGLLQRFMLVMAQEPLQGPQDRAEDRQARETYRSIVDVLLGWRGRPDEPVTLSEEAHAVREAVDAKIRGLGTSDVLHLRMRSHLRKWEGLFPRLCLTYHAIACADLAIEPTSVPVAGDTATRVGLFMFDYMLGHMLAFYDDVLGQSGFIGHARWIAGHLLAHAPESVSNRDIYKAYRAWRGLADWEKAGVISTLELSGWLRSSGRGRPGLPETRWFVNPAISSAFADRAAIEAKARASVVKMLEKLQSKP